MSQQEAGRARLVKLMDESRARQRIKWKDVALRGRLSEQHLRNIRNGHADTITTDAKYGIEQGLGWPDGTVDAILAGQITTLADIEERAGHLTPQHVDLRDDVERAIWSETSLPVEERWEAIMEWRTRIERGHGRAV